MQAIGETLKVQRKVSKANSERASIVEYFVQPLIDERREENLRRYEEYLKKNKGATTDQFKKTKEYLKPLTPRGIAIKLAHLNTDELYPFFKSCVEYSNKPDGSFSRAFFGALKTR